jgi:hypothetical protein
MSTRQSIFYDENPDTGVIIHIYEECGTPVPHEIRLEIESPHGVTNVLWPRKTFNAERLLDTPTE